MKFLMAKYVTYCVSFAVILVICIFNIKLVHDKVPLPTPMISFPAASSKLLTENITSFPPLPLSSCPAPNFGPFEPKFMHYFQEDHPKVCIAIQPDLVYKSSPFELSTDPDLMLENGVEYCAYQQIERIDKDDESFKYFPWVNFTQTAYINSLVAKVQCFKDRKAIYENVFYFIKKVKTIKRSNNTLNVLLFLMDGLSRHSGYRVMPQTLEFIKNKLKGHVFQYHIKSGEDTTPNLSAVITGKRSFAYKKRGKIHPAELPHCSTNLCDDDFVDDWPFVWKDFAGLGYVTALGEGESDGAIWNHMMKGFKKTPVDYYMRPFSIVWELSEKGQRPDSMGRCVQNIPYYQKVWEWTEEVVRLNRDQPLFGIFATDFGHNDNMLFKEVDRPLTEMLTKLYNEGLLNSSIVIIMGDHGISMGDFRVTWMGKMEASMPLFSVSLPPWLRETYPELDAALHHNTRRLTSFYDVHAMLKDIVHQRFEGGTHQKMQRGMSLFKKLPDVRTCEDAGVPFMYCPCYKLKQLSNTSSFVVEAGKKVLEHLNDQLKDYKEFCAELTFSHIQMAEAYLDVKEDITRNPDLSTIAGMRIVVVAEPSRGLYEATMIYENGEQVDREVLRLDVFFGQFGCITKYHLMPFCYCKSLLKRRLK